MRPSRPHAPPSPSPPSAPSTSGRARGRRAGLALALVALIPAAAAAQATPRPMDGWRVGVSVGGTGLLGVSVEWVGEGLRGVEATVATWAFHDVGLGLTGRQYFGGGYLRPVLGAGLWVSHSFAEGGGGTALLARAPLGFDWRATGEQFLGVTVAANRVLWMERRDPESEDVPVSDGRIVPLPEIAWRWRP